MIDVLYVSFNRLAYTRESFAALLANTDWSEVSSLYVADDASTDGTHEFLDGALNGCPVPYICNSGPFGGPVAAMCWYLDNRSDDTSGFAKIDNDTIVPPGWLPDMLRVLHLNPGLDILGMAPTHGPPTGSPDEDRGYDEARWIGGVGVIRHRAFKWCRPSPNGRFGFTEWQQNHPEVVKGWAAPDLRSFQLDQLPLEPWLSLAADYVERGWQRSWPPFSEDAGEYWEWWKPVVPDRLRA